MTWFRRAYSRNRLESTYEYFKTKRDIRIQTMQAYVDRRDASNSSSNGPSQKTQDSRDRVKHLKFPQVPFFSRGNSQNGNKANKADAVLSKDLSPELANATHPNSGRENGNVSTETHVQNNEVQVAEDDKLDLPILSQKNYEASYPSTTDGFGDEPGNLPENDAASANEIVHDDPEPKPEQVNILPAVRRPWGRQTGPSVQESVAQAQQTFQDEVANLEAQDLASGTKHTMEESHLTEDSEAVDDSLNATSLSELQTFPFDKTSESSQPDPAEQLKKLQEDLSSLQDSTTEEQAEYFRQLDQEKWNQAGDWFLEQFKDHLSHLLDARKEKRRVVTEFEDKIKERNAEVEQRQKTVDKAVKEMKTAGVRMLQSPVG